MDKFTSMINKQELRIGNWVSIPKRPYYDEDQTGLRQVADIDSEGINYLDHGSRGVFLKDIEPIPITPEILEKAGFILLEDHYILPDEDSEPEEDYWINKLDFSIGVTKDGYRIWNGCGYTEYGIGKPIDYLHQLQNVFYALTGQELELHL